MHNDAYRVLKLIRYLTAILYTIMRMFQVQKLPNDPKPTIEFRVASLEMINSHLIVKV